MTAGSNQNVAGVSGSNRRYWIIGILVAIALGLFLLVGAPASNRDNTGSTWGNNPDGYGAWYDYMQAQGAPIARWQKPISDLVEQAGDGAAMPPKTLIRILPSSFLSDGLTGLGEWIDRGDRLIVLTSQGPATAANFSAQFDSDFGEVTVETRRRFDLENRSLSPYEQEGTEISFGQSGKLAQQNSHGALLADEYGAVVWREPDLPSVISSTTPFLAANAYQASAGNFAFLADLATETGGSIWVDEYIHGYRDREVIVEEVAGTWLGYLAQTPVLIAAVQLGIILLVALVAQNRRIGAKQSLRSPKVNNSEAYIQALAGVLHKANNRDFLIETLVQAERKSLQRSLGLGEAIVSPEVLQSAWEQKTQRSAQDLSVLQARPKSEAALQSWLKQLQSLVRRASQKVERDFSDDS